MNTKSESFKLIAGLSVFMIIIAGVVSFIMELIVPNFWIILNWMVSYIWLTILFVSFIWLFVMIILEAIYRKLK